MAFCISVGAYHFTSRNDYLCNQNVLEKENLLAPNRYSCILSSFCGNMICLLKFFCCSSFISDSFSKLLKISWTITFPAVLFIQRQKDVLVVFAIPKKSIVRIDLKQHILVMFLENRNAILKPVPISVSASKHSFPLTDDPVMDDPICRQAGIAREWQHQLTTSWRTFHSGSRTDSSFARWSDWNAKLFPSDAKEGKDFSFLNPPRITKQEQSRSRVDNKKRKKKAAVFRSGLRADIETEGFFYAVVRSSPDYRLPARVNSLQSHPSTLRFAVECSRHRRDMSPVFSLAGALVWQKK